MGLRDIYQEGEWRDGSGGGMYTCHCLHDNGYLCGRLGLFNFLGPPSP